VSGVRAVPRHEGVQYLIEKSRRQEAVVVAIPAADFPKVIPGPIEFIALADNDPGTVVVESEVTFDCRRNLDPAGRINRPGMRDRQNRDDCCVIRSALDCKHDHAWAIFAPFFLPGLVLGMPQVALGDDKARFGRRNRHALRYFGSNIASR
jgi:hypothetical protein